MPECWDCVEKFNLSELICANTASEGDDCDCEECELYCVPCWDAD